MCELELFTYKYWPAIMAISFFNFAQLFEITIVDRWRPKIVLSKILMGRGKPIANSWVLQIEHICTLECVQIC